MNANTIEHTDELLLPHRRHNDDWRELWQVVPSGIFNKSVFVANNNLSAARTIRRK
jgi:hypothetical protein